MQETLGLRKGKYWWCWTQTARRLRLPQWMKRKGSWCLIHISLLFIACFVTQTGQYDLGGGNLQTAFWKPSFSMLRSYASSPAEHCWNLNSWHWLATSQRRFSSIFAEHVLHHRCIYSSLGSLGIRVSTYIFANLQKRTYTYNSLQFLAELNTRGSEMPAFITFHTNDQANWLVKTYVCAVPCTVF